MRKVGKKGLAGALARHHQAEQVKSKKLKSLEASIENQKLKDRSKSNGNTKTKKGKQVHHQKGLIPFDKESRLMLIGEGDFSFAVSIVKQDYVNPEFLVATSYDSLDQLKAKYPNVEEHLKYLEDMKVKVFHDIDANDLTASFKLDSKKGKAKIKDILPSIDYIMFNFPHTGRGMKDVDRNIRDHQKLMLNYFKSCGKIFDLVNDSSNDIFGGYKEEINSKILVTLFEGEPYNSWQIKMLGRSENWKVDKSGRFEWDLFPEYHHRRTNSVKDTTKPASERDARIYVFEKFKKVVKEESDSE